MSRTNAESWASRVKPMAETGPLAHEKFAWVGYGGRGPIFDLDHRPHPNFIQTKWSKRPAEKNSSSDDSSAGMLVPIITAAAIFAVGYYALVSL